MRKFLFLLLLFSGQANSQFVEGAMSCMVTGNVVVASEEGKFKTYSGIKGGVDVNERLILSYRVGSNSVYMTLNRDTGEKNTIINAFLSTDVIGTTAKKNSRGGFIMDGAAFNESLSFLPDYIRIKGFEELIMSRYYKNDWHGIYTAIHHGELTAHTLTLNCRHINDKMDSAFNIFRGFGNKK